MFKIKVNNSFDFDIDERAGNWTLNGMQTNPDVRKINSHTVSILHGNKSYLAEVVSMNAQERTCVIKVNGNSYSLEVRDQFDELLHELGMDKISGAKIGDLHAPMPGMVLQVLVKSGDEVKKGDNLLVLEAMKMENIIKCPADAVIGDVKIQPTNKVEKGQVLLTFR